jgi:tetratricopeptide (TPR) repeat protein
VRNWASGVVRGFLAPETGAHQAGQTTGPVKVGQLDREGPDAGLGEQVSDTDKSGKARDLSTLAVEQGPAAPKAETIDDQAVRFVDEAEQAYKTHNLDTALARITAALALNTSAPVRDRATTLKDKIAAIRDLTGDVKVNLIVKELPNLKVIRLQTGGEFTGVITEDTGEKVTFRANDGITMSLNKGEIVDIQAVKAEDQLARIVEEYNTEAREAADRNDALSFYDLGITGLRNDLKDEGFGALDKAYEMARAESGGLVQVVKEDKARTKLAEGIWQDDTGNRKMALKAYRECIDQFPNTKAAERAQKFFAFVSAKEAKAQQAPKAAVKPKPPAAAGTKPVPAEATKPAGVLDDTGKTLPVGAETAAEGEAAGPADDAPAYSRFKEGDAKKLSEADGYYGDALEHMKVAFKFRPSAKSNGEFKKAEELFRKAMAIYEPLYNTLKDPEIELKMIKTQEQMYSSLKLRTITG